MLQKSLFGLGFGLAVNVTKTIPVNDKSVSDIQVQSCRTSSTTLCHLQDSYGN